MARYTDRRRAEFGLIALATCLAGTASAQSVNIDFSTLSQTPSPDYAAAGVRGTWNGIAVLPGTVFDLVALDGQATDVTVWFNGGDDSVFDDAATQGDTERLLDDGLGGMGDVIVVVSFDGLRPGVYRATTYGWTPTQPDDRTLVVPNDDWDAGVILGGAWPGRLVEGISHGVHEIDVTGGSFEIMFGGGFWGATGFLNGLQLQRLTPADIDGDGLVGVSDLLEVLADWGPCGECGSDVDGDGVVGVTDLLEILAEWG